MYRARILEFIEREEMRRQATYLAGKSRNRRPSKMAPGVSRSRERL